MEKTKIQWTKVKIARLCAFCVCQAFSLVSLVYFALTGTLSQALICVLSVLCLCLPDLAERLFKMKIALPLYLFVLAYAICPMLGHAYKFYYHIPWWDTLLHTVGGVVFAIFGAYLPKVFLKKNEVSVLLCAALGLFFSISVSAVWEIIEYAADMLLHTDMQQDTIVSSLYSYLIGDTIGEIGAIEEIYGVTVNGVPLKGYIDLGVIDTMTDVIFETLGALAYFIVYLIDKGKRTAFTYLGKPQIEKTE